MWISIYDNKFYFREIGHVPETVVRFGSLFSSVIDESHPSPGQNIVVLDENELGS